MKVMIRILFLYLFISIVIHAQEKGNLAGKVTDAGNGDDLLGVNLVLQGTYYGAATDLNGNYRVQNINPGTYTIQVSLIGYKTMQFTGIKIESGKTTTLNIKLEETVLTLGQDVVVVGEKPLMDVEETQSKKTLSREDIELSSVEGIKDLVTQQAGVVQSDNAIHIRGGRSYENAFLLDGVSVQDPLAGTGFGLQLSSNAIEEVEVITGGFNAEFGQATSGIVNVKTREGGDKYNGYLSYKRDNFGSRSSNNVFNIDIIEANLSGPEPITSFLLPAL